MNTIDDGIPYGTYTWHPPTANTCQAIMSRPYASHKWMRCSRRRTKGDTQFCYAHRKQLTLEQEKRK